MTSSNITKCIACAAAFAGSSILGSCVSSEETGSGGSKAVEPQQTVTPIDSTQIRQQATESDGRKMYRGGAPFLAKSDTVEASLTRKSKFILRSVVRPVNPAYTVQIGAFSRAHNALRLQKIAKERFTDLVVLNNYEPADKLYRVGVGKFDTRKEAVQLLKELIQKFPDDYSQCWVNYIAK